MASFHGLKIIALFLFLVRALAEQTGFVYNGFNGSSLKLSGMANIKSGVLHLTNDTTRMIGHAFHPLPLRLNNSNSTNSTFSFSTRFVFSIAPLYPDLGGHGMAFVITPYPELKGALPSQYMGMLNSSNNGNKSNHLFAVEFDTVQDFEFGDINDNHVGVDLNSMVSKKSVATAYRTGKSPEEKQDLNLKSGENIQVWIDYSGDDRQLNVSVAPVDLPRPPWPLISYGLDLSDIILEEKMYVGFSSSTGLLSSVHCVLGWSFSINGPSMDLDIRNLPSIDSHKGSSGTKSKKLMVGVCIAAAVLLPAALFAVGRLVKGIGDTEKIEDWELEYGPHRFSYKELRMATKGFQDKELLGFGGFGRVYKGIIASTGQEIAVKRVSHESKQGIREFIAEISSIGRLRHRNLVQLQGWCRRKGELLLVYDYMSNGSLDKALFDNPKTLLSWSQRFRIVQGVAAGLLYLHEEWEQIVVHRDVKASNVLLDADLNGRLGDFGLARLYEHGKNPHTTRVVGTLGYLAPELTRTGKATTSTDVYSFGALLLEVACGRRPIEPRRCSEELVLVDWVWDFQANGKIFLAADPKLYGEYVVEEMEAVLKLGLWCSHPQENSRPTMRQVVQILAGDAPLPPLPSEPPAGDTPPFAPWFDARLSSHSSSSQTSFTRTHSRGSFISSNGKLVANAKPTSRTKFQDFNSLQIPASS
eukprot:Gb_04107 [translate_table: standard]